MKLWSKNRLNSTTNSEQKLFEILKRQISVKYFKIAAHREGKCGLDLQNNNQYLGSSFYEALPKTGLFKKKLLKFNTTNEYYDQASKRT